MRSDISLPPEQLATIAKNTGLGITGKVYFAFSRFLSTVLITRTIGPEQYGLYMIAMSLVSIAGIVGMFGLGSAMVRYVAHFLAIKQFAKVKGVLTFGTKVTLVSSLILMSTMIIFAEMIAGKIFGKPELTAIIRTMAISLPFLSLMQIFLSVLQGAQLVKYSIYLEQALRPTARLALIVLFFACGLGVLGVVWAWIIASILCFWFSAYFLYKHMKVNRQKAATVSVKDIFTFSLPLWLSNIIRKNNVDIGILLVGAFLTSEQAGIYSVGLRMMPFLLVPMMAFSAIFSPIASGLFAKDSMNELGKLYKTGSRWVVTLTLPTFVLMVYFSKEIVSIFGQGFSGSREIMIILLVAQMINTATGSTADVLSMTGKTIYNLMNSIITFILNIGLTILFIEKFGPIGAAYALGASITAIQLMQLVEVWALYRIHPFSFNHLKPAGSCLLSLLFMALFKNALNIPDTIHWVLFQVVLFLTSYIVLLMISGLSNEDRIIVEKIGRRIRMSF